ncbi:MAG: alpha-mannosidase, partial [Monoglobaceae bacterium]
NYYGKYAPHEATVDCIGHTHIDVAWMWTYAQTREKVQRSFSIVVELMKRYPEYKFTISQPQLLEYLKEEVPSVYADIKELVKQGRIDIEGAMWVEPDCNLPSGESLVRQIIWGKRFIKDEFGVDSKILWLPDVFGYSAAIPQILNKSGVDKFVTSKIGWNEFNQIPYDLFKWVGVDGTEVSTHFMTCRDKGWDNLRATSYVGRITPSYVQGTWDRQQQKEYTDEVFMTYGYGDGGGGPTEEMLEMQRRIHRGVIGVPKTEMMTATESLNRIEEKFEKNIKKIGKTPTWKGELYLEFHRGTYTAVGKVKRYNRKTEFMLHNAEVLSVLNMLKANGTYDTEKINKVWKTVLLNQFHDVIPGSSIHAVYDDVFEMYENAQESIKTVTDSAIDAIAQNIKGENKTVVFNPNGFKVTDVVKCGDEYITVKDIPPMGWSVIDKADEVCAVRVADKAIENKFYKVVFDEDFDIISIYDKREDREVVRTGKRANELIMYEDLPYSYDAWELSVYHKDKKYKIDEVVSYKPISEGARAGFEVVKRFRNSTITQRIYLYNELDRIDFDTVIDWHLRHIIVKAAFPVDVNTNKATYEIQFGNIERSHTENTSWDVAKFETCAHKWADISDNGYGMALMNDCKYGYSVVDDSTLQLSLLRSGNSSSEEVNDQGEHIMSYSIIPHRGSYIDGEIVKRAYAFNNPMIAREINNSDGELEQIFSLVNTTSENIVIDTVKKAENNDNIVFRLYESQNIKGKVKLSFGVDVKKLYLCDLLENIEKEIEVKDNTAEMAVNNFEIVTLMAELR